MNLLSRRMSYFVSPEEQLKGPVQKDGEMQSWEPLLLKKPFVHISGKWLYQEAGVYRAGRQGYSAIRKVP